MEKLCIENESNEKIYALYEEGTLTGEEINVVVACHGFGSHKESSTNVELMKKMKEYGIGTLAFDFTGHGESNESTEKIGLSKCTKDLDTVVNYLIKRYEGKSLKISLMGSSFGGAVVLNFITTYKQNIYSVVLKSPAIQMEYAFRNGIIKESLEAFKNRGYTYTQYGDESKKKISYNFYNELLNIDLYKKYEKRPKALLIIHGDEDDIAPIEHSVKLSDISNNLAKLYIMKGSDHRFKKPGELEKLIEVSAKYIKRRSLL